MVIDAVVSRCREILFDVGHRAAIGEDFIVQTALCGDVHKPNGFVKVFFGHERPDAEKRPENRDQGFLKHFVGGVLTSAEYHEMKRDYETRMETAVQTVRDLMRERSELEEQLERYVSLAEKLEALTPDSVVTAQLVDRLIDRVTVSGTTEISIDFTFQSGFERLHEVMRNG